MQKQKPYILFDPFNIQHSIAAIISLYTTAFWFKCLVFILHFDSSASFKYQNSGMGNLVYGILTLFSHHKEGEILNNLFWGVKK